MALANVSDIKLCRSLSYVVDSPSFSYSINSAISCVVNAAFAIAGAFFNSLVVFVFWRSPKLKKKIAYFLIMMLSSTDLAVALVVHPLYIVHSVSEIAGTANCLYKRAYQISQILFSGQSALTLFTMNIERYLSIVHPVFHRNRVTKRKCVAVVTAFGLLPLAIAVTRFLGSDVQLIITVMTCAICAGSCYAYTSIVLTARRVLYVTNAVAPRLSEANSSSRNEADGQSKSRRERRHLTLFLRDLKVAKTSFFVLACCLTCYLPNGIVLGVWTGQTTSLTNIVQAKVWTTSLVTINSTINCLIYFWANREFRQAWRQIMDQSN